MSNNYEIISLSQLEESVTVLTKINRELTSNASTLKSIINSITSNWQNEQGADIQSLMSNLNKVMQRIESVVIPTLTKYVEITSDVVTETKLHQQQTMN